MLPWRWPERNHDSFRKKPQQNSLLPLYYNENKLIQTNNTCCVVAPNTILVVLLLFLDTKIVWTIKSLATNQAIPARFWSSFSESWIEHEKIKQYTERSWYTCGWVGDEVDVYNDTISTRTPAATHGWDLSDHHEHTRQDIRLILLVCISFFFLETQQLFGMPHETHTG